MASSKRKRKPRTVNDPKDSPRAQSGGHRKPDILGHLQDPRMKKGAKKKRRKLGAPSKKDQPLDPIKVIKNCLGVGLSQARACLVAGITDDTLIEWKKADLDLARSIDSSLPKSTLGLALKMMSLTNSRDERVRFNALKYLLPKFADEFIEKKEIMHGFDDTEGETPDPMFL